MDARLSLVVALVLVLAGCASAPKPPEKHPGLTVFETKIDQPAAPDSIFRDGDIVNYTVLPSEDKPWIARFRAGCSDASGMMFYQTRGGMRTYSDTPGSQELPAAQRQVLHDSTQLRQACTYRPAPDWRALDTDNAQDWLVLDRNSAVHEDGLLKVWTGIRLAQYQVGSGNTLVGQTQERLAIDCAKGTFRRLSQFSVDRNGHGFTGLLDQNSTLIPTAQGTPAQRRLVAAACQPAETWASLAVPPARDPLPPHLDTPVAAPVAVAAVRILGLPEPRLSLQGVDYRYDVLILDGSKFTGLQRDDALSRDAQTGLLLLRRTDPLLTPRLVLGFRGLIELATNSFDRRTGKQQQSDLNITGLAFTGDWQRLPENGKVAYSLTRASFGKPVTSTVNCSIGAARPASQIHPTLQGQAKPVTCENVQTKALGWYERFNYLEDYGMFIPEAESNLVGKSTLRVHSVR